MLHFYTITSLTKNAFLAFGSILLLQYKNISRLKPFIQEFHVVKDTDQIGLCQWNIKYSVWCAKIQFGNIVKVPYL